MAFGNPALKPVHHLGQIVLQDPGQAEDVGAKHKPSVIEVERRAERVDAERSRPRRGFDGRDRGARESPEETVVFWKR